MRERAIITTLALITILGVPSLADETESLQTEVVVYDVSDLKPLTRVDDTEWKKRIGEMIELIQETIDPDHWTANGGTVGAICELNGTIVTRTTRANHGQIANLIGQLREQRGVMIHVEARFLLVTEKFIEEVGLGELMQKPACILAEDQGNFFIRAGQGNRRVTTLTAFRTTFYNHQRVEMTTPPNREDAPATVDNQKPAFTMLIQGSLSPGADGVALRFAYRFGEDPAVEGAQPLKPGGPITIQDRSVLMLDCGPCTVEGQEAPSRMMILIKPVVVQTPGEPSPPAPRAR